MVIGLVRDSFVPRKISPLRYWPYWIKLNPEKMFISPCTVYRWKLSTGIDLFINEFIRFDFRDLDWSGSGCWLIHDRPKQFYCKQIRLAPEQPGPTTSFHLFVSESNRTTEPLHRDQRLPLIWLSKLAEPPNHREQRLPLSVTTSERFRPLLPGITLLHQIGDANTI